MGFDVNEINAAEKMKGASAPTADVSSILDLLTSSSFATARAAEARQSQEGGSAATRTKRKDHP